MRRDVKAFLEELKKDEYSPMTLKVYSSILGRFHAKHKDITPVAVDNYIKDGTIYNTKYANQSKFLIIACFKSFLNYRDRADDARRLHFPKKDRRSPIALTKKQVKTLLSAVPQKDLSLQPRNKLILELLYSTGLRVSEVHLLNKSDIDTAEGFLLVRKGKGNKNRLVKLSDRWVVDYKEFVGRDKSDSPVFLSRIGTRLSVRAIQQMVFLASKKSKVMVSKEKFVSPHKLRSTYATHTYESGEDVLVIQEQLGHESLDTTRRYTKITKRRLKKLKSPLDSL